MIQDARSIYGVFDLHALESRWDQILGDKDRTRDSRKVKAYVNHSRWVANCPECNGGMGCWRASKTACCLGCGHEFFVIWPAKKDFEEIERLLLRRAKEVNRNWYPMETLLGLQTENAMNGEL